MKKHSTFKRKELVTQTSSPHHGLHLRSIVIGVCFGLAAATSISSIASNTNPNSLLTAQNNVNNINQQSTTVGNSYTNTITSNIPTITSSPVVADDNSADAQSAINTAAVGCGDASTQGSIAWTQQEVLKNRQILNTAPVDIDALFNGSSGGSSGSSCFADITKMIDLSIAIPDFSGMKAAAIAALRAYATRKVCTMVNEATKKALEPLNNAIDIINKNGTIDLNGAIQGAVTGGLGKIDPELADIYKTQAPAGQSVNVFPTETTQFNTDLQNVQNSVNNSINGMVNPSTGSNNSNGSNGNTWSNATNPTANTGNLAANSQTNPAQNNTSSGNKSSIFDSIFGN
ncbi:hypothetical protein [Acinetobacter gyllenbergii]|uniref:hypothetical protein n=1 Tax=Acinetobacter gyllenbergii TaxID=134534 RepID=UPI003F57C49F